MALATLIASICVAQHFQKKFNVFDTFVLHHFREKRGSFLIIYLQPKLDELHSITAFLRPGIICLTQTWLNDSISDSACNLHNYVCFRRDRLGRQRGGVCAYIDAHLPCKRLIDYEDHEVESLWISVRPFRLPRSITNILVGVV